MHSFIDPSEWKGRVKISRHSLCWTRRHVKIIGLVNIALFCSSDLLVWDGYTPALLNPGCGRWLVYKQRDTKCVYQDAGRVDCNCSMSHVRSAQFDWQGGKWVAGARAQFRRVRLWTSGTLSIHEAGHPDHAQVLCLYGSEEVGTVHKRANERTSERTKERQASQLTNHC